MISSINTVVQLLVDVGYHFCQKRCGRGELNHIPSRYVIFRKKHGKSYSAS